MSFRIGQGYDVHRLIEGRPLMLGGVCIPFVKGLDGHSDADVLIHAIADAMLGAAGLGDIGLHFPDNDKRYAGLPGAALLSETYKRVVDAGYSVVNVDTTVVAEQPKLAPFREAMAKNIACVLCIETGAVNVKAKTEEGLGFTGSGEAIAAHAVCLLVKE